MRISAAVIIVMLIKLFLIPTILGSEESDRAKQAIEALRELCLVGDAFEITLKGDAGISLFKRGGKGEVIFTKENKRGVVDGLEHELKVQELENIRDCIEPRIDRIIETILGAQQGQQSSLTILSDQPKPQARLVEMNPSELSQTAKLSEHEKFIDSIENKLKNNRLDHNSMKTKIASLEEEKYSSKVILFLG
ncbi:MAG: hypothetical protein ETSY2_44765 [Candidatus Entotheonella gemina]|uniref:Uncharacterized protein n=1 Tax=Candidatus Entotheonella gemina TaxID=1429439 RepID=W4LHB8_9BACT|nr:MAG: hypothetical protein ETSY2_44765 [Candidatus Entotheonella gemina]